MDTILVVNAGSSSLKFQVFSTNGTKELRRLIKGQMEGIGTRPRLRAEDMYQKPLIDQSYAANEVADLPAAVQAAAGWLRASHSGDLIAVGHRVVHGGPQYHEPVLVDAEVLARLERYAPLAPLHQPNNLAPIRLLLEREPNLPQVACFDTAFHRSHAALADHFAIPERFYQEGVRRYGFHGLSYEYVAERLLQVAPEIAMGRVIVAHLGSGASMCALARGRSVDSTMGFTALEGLPMGTRPGHLDPGVVLYLIREKGMTAAQVEHLLYHECGLKGLSGISNDVRELQNSADPRAAFAIEYFVYRVGLHAGMLAAALGGLDAFVFTAGIGENAAMLRARIADRLGWLGAALDPAANTNLQLLISTPDSRVALYVIPTDEELTIARHTLALLARGSTRMSAVDQKKRQPDAERISWRAMLIDPDATRRPAGMPTSAKTARRRPARTRS
jgi:acetate kinase